MKLAKAEAIYKPNLLINGDFKIWQRGDSVSVASSQKGYTADRWLLQNNRTDVPITAYRIYDGSDNPTVQQYYENYGSGISALTVSSARFLYLMDIEEAKKYEGKTVVLSYSLNKEITVNEPYTFTITETDKTNGYVQCFYRLMDIGEVLNWVKLELGSIATPLVPRLIAEEFPLCQRYEQISNYVHGMGIAYYGSVLLYLPLSCPLRVTPKVSFSGTVSAIRDGIDSQNITSMTYVGHSDSLVIIACATSGSVENGTVWRVEGGKIELDAEIK